MRTTKVSCRRTIHRAPVDLVGGHTGGTFYIRARLRAGACVPVASETLGRFGFVRSAPLRVARSLAVWTLSLAVQIRMSVGC